MKHTINWTWIDLSNSPASTLYDSDSFDIENNNNDEPLKFAGLGLSSSPSSHNHSKANKLVQKRNSILSKLFQNNFTEKLVKSFGLLSTIIFNLLNYLMFIYFLVLLPNGLACLNLLGQGSKVFNLLAHFIKGGVFFSLGLLSLARYCGCYSQMGGAWNYSFITDKERSIFIKKLIELYSPFVFKIFLEISPCFQRRKKNLNRS